MYDDADISATVARLIDDLEFPRCHEELIILADRVYDLLRRAHAPTPAALERLEKEKPQWLRELSLALEHLKNEADAEVFIRLAEQARRAVFRHDKTGD